MEWLENNVVAPILGALLTLVIGWHWYDKKQRDNKFDRGEKRMQAIEKELASVEKQHEVLAAKVDGLKELVDIRMSTLSDSMNRIEDLCVNMIRESK